MSQANTQRPTDRRAEDKRPMEAASKEKFVEKLARARTANEMTSLIGLKPIKGRSGPKIAY